MGLVIGLVSESPQEYCYKRFYFHIIHRREYYRIAMLCRVSILMFSSTPGRSNATTENEVYQLHAFFSISNTLSTYFR